MMRKVTQNFPLLLHSVPNEEIKITKQHQSKISEVSVKKGDSTPSYIWSLTERMIIAVIILLLSSKEVHSPQSISTTVKEYTDQHKHPELLP